MKVTAFASSVPPYGHLHIVHLSVYLSGVGVQEAPTEEGHVFAISTSGVLSAVSGV